VPISNPTQLAKKNLYTGFTACKQLKDSRIYLTTAATCVVLTSPKRQWLNLKRRMGFGFVKEWANKKI
jgi:hypothetical protein